MKDEPIVGNDKIIDGKKCAALILAELKQKIEILKINTASVPKIAIILIGDNPSSVLYVRNKIKAAANIGLDSLLINLPNSVTQTNLIEQIAVLNFDVSVSGIILQLPIPSHINKKEVLCTMNPNKDVDGLHPLNIGYLHSNIIGHFVPPTALGCLALIKSCVPDLSGKTAVVVGRSELVGQPLAALLLQSNCTITICHSKTLDLKNITKRADIVIVAVGVPKLLTVDYFHANSVVIDVGINKMSDGTIAGDVDFVNLCDRVGRITPVPGGVGPMTIAFLLSNTVTAYCLRNELTEFYV